MKRLLPFLILLWCLTVKAANPAFTDFDTNQFRSNPSGAQPKISLLSGGVVTNYVIENITNTILVSSNIYATNIFTTNLFTTNLFGPFITNFTLYSTNIYTTNLFTTNLFGPYITNDFFYSTNIFSSNAYITNLYTSNAFITNLFVTNAYITNLFTSNAFITNITANFITNFDTFITSNTFTTNLFTTNLITETIQTITNISQTTFVTNLFVDNSVTTNLTVNYFTVLSNANITGYIRDFAGLGTNTTIYSPTLWTPVYILSTNGPVRWYFLDADNSTILSGWDTNKNGFFGNGGGLTNLQGTIQSSGSSFGWIVVTNGITNQLLTASTVIKADANKSLASIANASGVLTNDAAGGVGFNSGLRLSGDVYTASITITNGATNRSLTASQFIVTDANKAESSTLNGNTLTNLAYQYTTNAFTALNIPWQQALFTNIAANFTVTLSAPAATFYESSILYVTNSSGTDFKVTFPSGVWGSPGSGTPPAYYCTNKMLTTILVQHFGQLMTNAIKQDYAP